MLQTARVPLPGDQFGKLRMATSKIRRRDDMDERARGILTSMMLGAEPLGAIEHCECFGMGETISIIVGRFRDAGWCLIMTHTKRLPSWDELAEARYKLLPADVNVTIPFPSSQRRVPLHANSCQMWEAEFKQAKRLIVTR